MYDCVIVGAGLAGLTAALDLRARGHRALVLEARNRVGGRVENVVFDDGYYLELGGQWIGPGHEEVLALARSYNISTIDYAEQRSMRVRANGESRTVSIQSRGTELTPFEVSDLAQGLLRLRRLSQRMIDDPQWQQTNLDWLEQSLQRWVSANLRTQPARLRFLEVWQGAIGPLTAEVSLGQGLERLACVPEMEALFASNGGLNQVRLTGGVFALCQAMADDLGEIIQFGKVVRAIRQRAEAVEIELTDGATLQARLAVSTLSPRLAVELQHDPPLPKWRHELAHKVPAGNVIKVFLVYDTPFWYEEGLSGQSSSDDGYVRVTLDASTNDGRGVLTGFFEGPDAVTLAAMSEQARRQAFIDSAVGVFGPKAAEPVAYVERNWATEEFTKGCHGAHFVPGLWSGNGPSLAESDGRVYWAGAEYASQFNGYLEGAVRSGRDVARRVSRRISDG